MIKIEQMLDRTKGPIYLLITVALGTAGVLAVANNCPPPGQRTCHFKAFTDAAFLFSFLLMLISYQALIRRLIHSSASAIYWLIAYAMFVSYQDHPWFAQAPLDGCDGPCFGWYTFENEPLYMPLFAISMIGLLLGLIAYCGIKGVLQLVRRWG